MQDRYVTGSEIGRRAAVSKAAVAKAIKEGRIPTVTYNGRRLIDTEDIIVQKYINADRPNKQAPTQPSPSPEENKTTPNPPRATPNPLPTPSPRAINIPDSSRNPLTQQPQTDDVKTQLDYAKLEAQQLKNQEARRSLIPTEFFKKVLSEYFAIDQGQTLQLEHTIATRICEEIFEKEMKDLPEDMRSARVTAAAKIINEATYKIQAHKKRLITDRLKEIGEKLDGT